MAYFPTISALYFFETTVLWFVTITPATVTRVGRSWNFTDSVMVMFCSFQLLDVSVSCLHAFGYVQRFGQCLLKDVSGYSRYEGHRWCGRRWLLRGNFQKHNEFLNGFIFCYWLISRLVSAMKLDPLSTIVTGFGSKCFFRASESWVSNFVVTSSCIMSLMASSSSLAYSAWLVVDYSCHEVNQLHKTDENECII